MLKHQSRATDAGLLSCCKYLSLNLPPSQVKWMYLVPIQILSGAALFDTMFFAISDIAVMITYAEFGCFCLPEEAGIPGGLSRDLLSA